MSWIKDSSDVFAALWRKFSEFVRTHSIWISQMASAIFVLGEKQEWFVLKPDAKDAWLTVILLGTGIFMKSTNVAATRVDTISDKKATVIVNERMGTGSGTGGGL